MGEGERRRRRDSVSKLKSVARRIVQTCGSFSSTETKQQQSSSSSSSSSPSPSPSPSSFVVDPIAVSANVLKDDDGHEQRGNNVLGDEIEQGNAESSSSLATTTTKNVCAICLDPLSYSSREHIDGQSIFTAQCSHAFHFDCISSNVRHGNITCPICRSHWTQLPRYLNPLPHDPVLRILDDSIATFRVHRRSFLRSARYDDDDPIEPHDYDPNNPRLNFSLVQAPCQSRVSSLRPPIYHQSPQNLLYLSVKMNYPQAVDLVIVACLNGPHLRLLKHSMALIVYSLRSIDRVAIVVLSSTAARVFPLRRMTPYGKRSAIQVIDRLFFMGQADSPSEGVKKGLKILNDRVHKNPLSCIVQVSDRPIINYNSLHIEEQIPIPIHNFHIGDGFELSKLEELLERIVGSVVREIRLWIGDQDEKMMVMIGEVKSGEERRVQIDIHGRQAVYVGYSYVEDRFDDKWNATRGEVIVPVEEKPKELSADENDEDDGGRTSVAESWDYHDPYMARRWAKHLHGYRR